MRELGSERIGHFQPENGTHNNKGTLREHGMYFCYSFRVSGRCEKKGEEKCFLCLEIMCRPKR